MLKRLIKFANKLDDLDLSTEADEIDQFLFKSAEITRSIRNFIEDFRAELKKLSLGPNVERATDKIIDSLSETQDYAAVPASVFEPNETRRLVESVLELEQSIKRLTDKLSKTNNKEDAEKIVRMIEVDNELYKKIMLEISELKPSDKEVVLNTLAVKRREKGLI